MKRLRRSRMFLVALAVWLGLGTVVSSTLAADMSSQMAMTTAMDSANPDNCPACGHGDGNVTSTDCLPFCHLAGSVVIPPAAVALFLSPAAFTAGPEPLPDSFVVGFDPSPPKPTIHN